MADNAKLIIGDNAFIGSRCTIYAGVTIGNNFDISDQSSVFYDNESFISLLITFLILSGKIIIT